MDYVPEGKFELSSPSLVQSSPVQVEGLGLSLWSLLPTTTTTTTANFEKIKWILYSIKSQKILSYIIIPTAHHHHHRKLFKK